MAQFQRTNDDLTDGHPVDEHSLDLDTEALDIDALDIDATISLASLRILVAEAKPRDRNLLLQLLRQLGYNAPAVDNGDAVLDALQTADYDVIFMALEMSPRDGLATARSIRQTIPASHQPYLIALAMQPDQQPSCRAAGISSYLRRPIALLELQGVLQAAAQYRLQRPDLQRLRLADLEVQRAGGRNAQTPKQTPEPFLPDSAHSSLDPCALEVLRQIAGESAEDFVAEMIDSYLQEIPHLVAGMTGAIAQANFADIVRHTHSIKSMSAALGATQLAEHCQQIEILAHHPKEQDSTLRIVAALQRSLNAELEEVCEALKAARPTV
ncbi:MAG: response regulator [Synechococcales cyanobacterium CRU_2_2]|nr:response regulator [Synechococcales cyanobacterium CRU_2_2]